MHPRQPPGDQPRRVQERPATGTWATIRPTRRVRQPQPDDVREQAGLRQPQIETDRLQALPGSNHAAEQPIESRPDKGNTAVILPILLDRRRNRCKLWLPIRRQLPLQLVSGRVLIRLFMIASTRFVRKSARASDSTTNPD